MFPLNENFDDFVMGIIFGGFGRMGKKYGVEQKLGKGDLFVCLYIPLASWTINTNKDDGLVGKQRLEKEEQSKLFFLWHLCICDRWLVHTSLSPTIPCAKLTRFLATHYLWGSQSALHTSLSSLVDTPIYNQKKLWYSFYFLILCL